MDGLGHKIVNKTMGGNVIMSTYKYKDNIYLIKLNNPIATREIADLISARVYSVFAYHKNKYDENLKFLIGTKVVDPETKQELIVERYNNGHTGRPYKRVISTEASPVYVLYIILYDYTDAHSRTRCLAKVKNSLNRHKLTFITTVVGNDRNTLRKMCQNFINIYDKDNLKGDIN